MSTGCSHMMKSGKRAGTNCGGKITALCKEGRFCCKHRALCDGKVNVKDLSKTKVVKEKTKPAARKPKSNVAKDLSESLSTDNLEDIQEPGVSGSLEDGEEVVEEECDPVSEGEESLEEPNQKETDEYKYGSTYNERVKRLNEERRQASLAIERRIEPKNKEPVGDDEDDEEDGSDLEDFKKLLSEVVNKLGSIYSLRSDVKVVRVAIRDLSHELEAIISTI